MVHILLAIIPYTIPFNWCPKNIEFLDFEWICFDSKTYVLLGSKSVILHSFPTAILLSGILKRFFPFVKNSTVCLVVKIELTSFM